MSGDRANGDRTNGEDRLEALIGDALTQRAGEVQVVANPDARSAVDQRLVYRAHRRRTRSGLVVGAAVAGLAVVALQASLWSDDDDGEAVTTDTPDAIQEPAPGPANRCDLGFNTTAYNQTTELTDHPDPASHSDTSDVDFTIEEWASVFTDESLGASVDQVVETYRDDPIRSQIVLTGGLTHTLEPDPWMPMTDPAECEQLAEELSQARAAIEAYPDVAAATADGYVRTSGRAPGQGAHYRRDDRIDEVFDPNQPEMLMFDGLDDDAQLVGVVYWVTGPRDEAPPEGFTGSNDHWYRHDNVCVSPSGFVVIGPGGLTAAQCAELGGTQTGDLNGWMAHAWVVPGCENDWGVFSQANPASPYIPPDIELEAGCNSGTGVDDPLQLDQRGDGPAVGP